MKRRRIKILSLLLVFTIILSGCSNSRIDSRTSKYLTPDNFIAGQDVSYSDKQKKIQKQFDKFLDNIFVEDASTSMISTHFSIENPENYGITDYQSVWGDILPYIDGDFSESNEQNHYILSTLDSYNREDLNYEQQIIYDTLEMYIKNNQLLSDYYYFDEPFSPMNGAHADILLTLSEFEISDSDDLKDYMTAVENCDDYYHSLMEFEKKRAADGYSLTDSAMDDVIEQCGEIIAQDQLALIPVFNDKISDCDFLSDAEKKQYIDEHTQIVNNQIKPLFQETIDMFTGLKGSRSVDGGLCKYEGGKEYYEALVRLYTGSAKSPQELIQCVEKNLSGYTSTITSIVLKNQDALSEYSKGLDYIYEEPSEILDYLCKTLKHDFPEAVTDKYTVGYVHKSLEASLNPAFYIIAPIDNKDKNNIFINNNEKYKNMDLFPTLAHEGYPGHLYQTTYFYNTNPRLIRYAFSFKGYVEGWAKYVEHYSYKWCGADKDCAKLAEIDDLYGFALYSRLDLGINYEGWNLDKCISYLQSKGLDKDTATTLYETLVNDPGIYLQYYIGNVEILELIDKAKKELGDDFDIKKFHKFFLEVGPTYFDIIDDCMDKWIKTQK